MGHLYLSRGRIYNATIKIPRGVDTMCEYALICVDCKILSLNIEPPHEVKFRNYENNLID